MYTLITNHNYNSLDDALKNAIKHGFTIEFVVNERGFSGQGKITYLPESVEDLEVILFTQKRLVLYLLRMIDGKCGWMSDFEGTDKRLAEHLTRIKENCNYLDTHKFLP